MYNSTGLAGGAAASSGASFMAARAVSGGGASDPALSLSGVLHGGLDQELFHAGLADLGRTLAYTGANVLWVVLAGFALVAAGMAMLRMVPRTES